jgi:uncharacterized RDD family membrane protein YckC
LTDFSGPIGHFIFPVDDPGMLLVPPASRLSALLLDVALVVVTLGAGWLVWSLVVWHRGQTPAKQLLGHIVADATTGEPVSWGRMALRELVVRALLGAVLGLVTASVYLLADAALVFSTGHRTLHDHLAGSVVRYR